MKRRMAWYGAVTLAVLASCAKDGGSVAANSAAGGAKPDATEHAWQMKQVTFTDRDYKDPNAPAGTLLVPPDWQVKGDGVYLLDCAFDPPGLKISAARTDGLLGFDTYPGMAEVWSDNPTVAQNYRTSYGDFKVHRCQVRETPTLDFLLHDSLRILALQADGAVQPIPKLDAQLQANVAKTNAMLAQQPNGGHLVAAGGRLHFTGAMNGKTVEGWLNIILATRSMPLPQGGTVYMTNAPLICLMYAPPGQFETNERMLNAILGTIQIDPQWQATTVALAQQTKQMMDNTYARLAQIHHEMVMDNIRTQQNIANIRRGTQAYANQVYSHVAHDRAAALDHSAQQFSLYMGDQAIYRNPSTGARVQMSSNYGHAWASSTGNSNDYVLTDSASFDPNGKIGSGGWTELQQEH